MRERWRPLLDTTATIFAVGLLYELAFGAFSRETKRQIWDRANGASELTGKSEADGYVLECSHFNHNRTYPDYDNPLNGLLVTTFEHLQMHIKHGVNGLTQAQNDWSIRAIKERLREQFEQGYKIE